MTVAEAVDRLPRRVAGWAAARSLAPNSMTGISLALGLCAAVWFTAGTRPGNAAGALALGGSYLAGRSARRLARTPAGTAAAGPAGRIAGSEPAASASATARARSAGRIAGSEPAARASATAAARPAGRIGAREPAARASVTAGRGSGPAGTQRAGDMTARELAARAKAISDRRLARAGAAATECGTCVGLAAGGPLAGGIAAGSLAGGLLPGWGMWQLATITVIMVAVSQLAMACGGGAQAGRRPDASPCGLRWRVLGMPYGGRVLLIAVAAPVFGARGVFLGLAGWAVIAFGYAIVSSRRRPGGTRAARAILARRDDGLIATEIGLPVRGQLVPLPPALTGVAAVAVLAILGLRNLPGFLLLAPVVAMLLAAVGSSHPHDGRLDWLVPVLLQAGQFGYLAAIGAAAGVPATLIFTVCALTALHYADLAGHASGGTAVGWDGRMVAAGLGAALGMATFAYLLLAAYLCVLIWQEFMACWLPATEGDGR